MHFMLGMELHAKYTLFAEGARGHLGRQLMERFRLDENSDPQVYGLGIRELWEIDNDKKKSHHGEPSSGLMCRKVASSDRS